MYYAAIVRSEESYAWDSVESLFILKAFFIIRVYLSEFWSLNDDDDDEFIWKNTTKYFFTLGLSINVKCTKVNSLLFSLAVSYMQRHTWKKDYKAE